MIYERATKVRQLLDNVIACDKLVTSGSFEPSTIADIKNNAKAICGQVKSEVDEIKAEIDQWS